MQKNGAVLTIACILLLFTFNYTLPLRKETSKPKKTIYGNESLKCHGPLRHESFVEKMKNVPANLQNVIRKIRNSTQKEINAVFGHKNFSNHNLLSEEDIRHYEQLVIMKKYPYLDIKELEMKYSPVSNKDTRQSVKYHSRVYIPHESGICEPADDSINVEISNRGLSGFAIPTQLVKHKLKSESESIRKKPEITDNLAIKPVDRNVLTMLKNDINMFIQKREIK